MEPIIDLGISFAPKLKFDYHINNITNRSNKILDFIIKDSADFTDEYILKSFKRSFVRSICEYYCVI